MKRKSRPGQLALIKRDKSLVTGKKNLEHLVTYRHYPIFIGCTDEPISRDLFVDMSFSICRDSGIVQLDNLVPPDILYSRYHSEALGGVWKKHHEEFVSFLRTFGPKNILEVGGSNCIMAEEYVGKRKDISWTNVEPNPVKSRNPRIKVIAKPFDERFGTKQNPDAIVHSHVLEHMFDPDVFLRHVNSILKKGDAQLFSVPNLDRYLSNDQSNCVNFEHTIFLTEYFVDYFLAKNGFKILEKKYFHDHSIFYATRKMSDGGADVPVVPHYKEYKRRFARYIRNSNAIAARINKKIARAPGNVYLVGAHVFSQMLMNLGVDTRKVKCILDNSKIKQGKRLYGTKLRIKPLESIRGEKNPTVVVRMGAYQKEVKDQLRRINSAIIYAE